LQQYNYNIDVHEIRFEWDEAKNLSNQRKHGIRFEEASRVFFDPLHIVVEQRWQALGLIRRDAGALLLLLVAHTVREDEQADEWIEVIRIISARRATPEERRIYEDENR
jgi:hypothetical protein